MRLNFRRADLEDRGEVGFTLKGLVAGQQFIEHDSERKHVGQVRQILFADLLGRHVRGRTHQARQVRGFSLECQHVPKSVSLTSPSACSSRLAGLMSRWTRPCVLAYSKALLVKHAPVPCGLRSVDQQMGVNHLDGDLHIPKTVMCEVHRARCAPPQLTYDPVLSNGRWNDLHSGIIDSFPVWMAGASVNTCRMAVASFLMYQT